MKIVVIGGTGLIGSKLVAILLKSGHQAVAAAPSTGVDTVTGAGLAQALDGASVIVDVSNSPSFEDRAVIAFFETCTTNLLQYGMSAKVGHIVALSVVGARLLPASAYLRAKVAQETLIQQGKLPYSIVHATQFFEFVKPIADLATQAGQVRVAPVFIQPMAADDVALALANVAVGNPLNGILELAGPERFRLDELIRHALKLLGDPREVIADPDALYFGARLTENALVPQSGAKLSNIRFDDWMARASPK